MTDRNYFQGKRIAVIGLGPHGEMVEDIKFLIKAGALVSIYDLRSEARLKKHLVFLRTIGLANYVCGQIPADDLLDSDLIILSHEYPRNSSFLKNLSQDIPVEYPETLFFKLAPPLSVVGVIGSVGKSAVISMLAPMLESVCVEKKGKNSPEQNFFLADPQSGGGILPCLKKAKNGDIFLIRIVSAMMVELHALRISPQVAIFTTLPHKNAYKESPFEILEYQTYNNFLIASDEVIDLIRIYDYKPRAKMLRTKTNIIPPYWECKFHEHEKSSAALALQAARLFKVSDDLAQKVIETWKPLRGRLEPVKKIKGIEFYNDTASSSPAATLTGLTVVSKKRNVVLILGGGENSHDYQDLCRDVPQYAHTIVLLPGSGTMRQRIYLQNIKDTEVLSAPNLEEAVRLAREHAKTGDIVLFSPGFAAYGIDVSEKERGERFVRAVRTL